MRPPDGPAPPGSSRPPPRSARPAPRPRAATRSWCPATRSRCRAGRPPGQGTFRAVSRPACLVTGTVNDYRREPFRELAESQDVEVIAWREAGPPVPGLTVHRTTQAGAVGLAGSGRYRAVISGLGGRLALPGSYLAARARGIPFVLWATIWAHPRTPAHALSLLPTRALYRRADAVATYGPHVSDYVHRYRREDGV